MGELEGSLSELEQVDFFEIYHLLGLIDTNYKLMSEKQQLGFRSHLLHTFDCSLRYDNLEENDTADTLMLEIDVKDVEAKQSFNGWIIDDNGLRSTFIYYKPDSVRIQSIANMGEKSVADLKTSHGDAVQCLVTDLKPNQMVDIYPK